MDIGYLAYVLGIKPESKERVKAELKQFTAELQSLDNITFNFDANAVKELTKEASGLQRQVEQVKNEFKEATKPVDEFDAELKALLQTAGNLKSLRVTGLIDTSEYKRDLEATKTQLIDFANELGTASAQAQPLIKAAADLEQQLQGLYQEELRATQQTEKLQAEFAKNSARGTAETYTDLRARLSQLLDETSRGVNTTEDAAKAFRNLADEARRLSPALEADAKAFTQFNNLSRQAVSAADRVEGKVNRLSFANQVLAGNARVAVNSLTGYGPAGIIADTALDSIIAGSGGAATASLGLAAGIGAVVAGAVALDRVGADSFKSLQSSIAQLKANGVDDIEAVRSKIEQIQDQSKIFRSLTEAEYASATAEIVKANRSAAESLDILRASVILAVAEGTDLNDTSLALSTSLRQFGESTALAEDYAGKFAKAGNLANTAASNFAIGVGDTADQAFKAGFSIDELLGVLVEIDNKGFDPAEKGARGFNAILSGLASPSEKAKAAIDRLGVSLVDSEGKVRPLKDVFFEVAAAIQASDTATQDANDIFDTFGARTIAKVTDEARKFADEIDNADGFLQTFKETAEDTNRALSERGLVVAITDLGAAFSELINPALVPFLDAVTLRLNNLNNLLFRNNKGTIGGPITPNFSDPVISDFDLFKQGLNTPGGYFGALLGDALGQNNFGSGNLNPLSNLDLPSDGEVNDVIEKVVTLGVLNEELKNLKEQFNAAPLDSELQKSLAVDIKALESQIDSYDKLISTKTSRNGSKSDLQKLLENLAKATTDYQEQVANLGAAYNAGLIDQEELYSEKLKATDKAINTLVGSYTVLSDSQKTLLDSLISSKTELQGFLDEIERQQVLTDYQNGLSLINAEFEITGDKAAALSSQLGLTQSTFDKLLEIALSDGVFSDSEREAIQLYADSINNVTAAIDALPEKLSALELTQRYVDKLKLLNESGFLSNADLIKELEFQKTKLEGLRNDAIAQGNLSEAADIQARLQAITGLADTVTQAVKTSDDALEQLRQDRIAFEQGEAIPSTLSAGGIRQVIKDSVASQTQRSIDEAQAAREALLLLGLDPKTIRAAGQDIDVEALREEYRKKLENQQAYDIQGSLALLGLDDRNIELIGQAFDYEKLQEELRRNAKTQRAVADQQAAREALLLLGLDPKTIRAAADEVNIEDLPERLRERLQAQQDYQVNTALALLGLDDRNIEAAKNAVAELGASQDLLKSKTEALTNLFGDAPTPIQAYITELDKLKILYPELADELQKLIDKAQYFEDTQRAFAKGLAATKNELKSFKTETEVYTDLQTRLNDVLGESKTPQEQLLADLKEALRLYPALESALGGYVGELEQYVAQLEIVDKINEYSKYVQGGLNVANSLAGIDLQDGGTILDAFTTLNAEAAKLIPIIGESLAQAIELTGEAVKFLLGDLENGQIAVKRFAEDYAKNSDNLAQSTVDSLVVTQEVVRQGLAVIFDRTKTTLDEKATSFGLGIAESVAEGFKRGLIGTDADFKQAFAEMLDNLKAEAIIQLPPIQEFIARYSKAIRDALANDNIIDAAEQATIDAIASEGEALLRQYREQARLNRPTDITQTDNLAPIQTSTFNLPTGGLSVSESFSWTGEMANIINNFRSGVDKFVEGTSRFANTATNLDARLATLLRT